MHVQKVGTLTANQHFDALPADIKSLLLMHHTFSLSPTILDVEVLVPLIFT